MTTITIATRTKETPNSKLGLSFSFTSSGKLMISIIKPTSIFVGSGLRVGQELLSINGVSVRGKSTDEVAAMLASLEREVTIQAGPGKPGKQSCTLSCSLVRTQGGAEVLKFDSQQAQRVPTFLQSMGVSHHKWSRVVKAFTTELMPATQQTLAMDHVLRSEMEHYTGKQMNKGHWGFGMESQHERKVFMMTHQAAVQHANQTLVANNVVSKANALLNVHGVMAELEFKVMALPNFSSKQRANNTISIPTTIKFTPIDDSDCSDHCGGVDVVDFPQTVVANATAIPSAPREDIPYC